MQQLFDDLTAADGAARAFLDCYADYLQVGARFHLDRIAARTEQVVRHATAISEARTEMRRAGAAQDEAREACKVAGIEQNRFAGRLEGLKKHEAYTAQGQLDSLRGQVGQGAQEIAREREANTRAAEHIVDLGREADGIEQQLKNAREAAGRQASDMAEAAGLAGLTTTDGGDPQAVRAQVTARLEDVEDVRRRLEKVDEAERERGRAEQAVQKAGKRIEAGERACETAERELGEARAQAEEDLRAWAGRWSGDHTDPVVGVEVLRFGRAAYLPQDPGRYLVTETALAEVALAAGEERAWRALEQLELTAFAKQRPRDSRAASESGSRSRRCLRSIPTCSCRRTDARRRPGAQA